MVISFNVVNSIILASPPLVTDIKVYSIGMHSFDISWGTLHACQSSTQEIGYRLVYQRLTQQGVLDENNVTITVERNTTNYTVAGLERNETYCVRILAFNENGDGYLSNCTEVTTATGNVISSWQDCIWSFIDRSHYICINQSI